MILSEKLFVNSWESFQNYKGLSVQCCLFPINHCPSSFWFGQFIQSFYFAKFHLLEFELSGTFFLQISTYLIKPLPSISYSAFSLCAVPYWNLHLIEWKMVPSIRQVLILGINGCSLILKKEFVKCEPIQDNKIGRLSCIISMETKYKHKCSCKRETKRDFATKGEECGTEMKERFCCSVYGGHLHKLKRQCNGFSSVASGKSGTPLTLRLKPNELISEFWPENCKKVNVCYFKSPIFVLNCDNSKRKLICNIIEFLFYNFFSLLSLLISYSINHHCLYQYTNYLFP